MFSLPETVATPEPAPVDVQADPAAAIPVEAPTVDLVVPERLGTVVDLVPASRVEAGLAVATTYPDAPGLYRLVPTLHTPSGEAYDAATQALLTPVFVRVGGAVAVAYGAPASLDLAAASTAVLPVRVLNAGSEAWDQFVTTAPGEGEDEDEAGPNGRITHLPATLTATWVSAHGHPVPSASVAALDPDISGPGTEVEVVLGLEAPETPGEYLLLLDVVSPALGPLSALGTAPALVRVTVTEPIPEPTAVPPQRQD
jgi:hypothetical protein